MSTPGAAQASAAPSQGAPEAPASTAEAPASTAEAPASTAEAANAADASTDPAHAEGAPDLPTGIPVGLYVCQNTGTPDIVGLPNFELREDGSYRIVVAGARDGEWSYDEGGRLVIFETGTFADWPLEGVYVPGSDPGRGGSETIFLRERGDGRSPDEAAFPACYLSRKGQGAPPTEPDSGPAPAGSVTEGPVPGTYSCWANSVIEEDALTLEVDGTYKTDIFTGGDVGNWSYNPSSAEVAFDGPGFVDYVGRMVEDGSGLDMPGPTLVLLVKGLEPVPGALGQYWCQIAAEG